MAYYTKYTTTIADHSGNTYTINLKKINYTGGTTTLKDYSVEPVIISYRGGREQIDNSIRGSECDFNFYVHENEDFDELITSNYKDWQLEVLNASGSTTISSGSTSLHNDTSTGSAWSTSGSSVYNTFTITTTTTTTTTTTLAPANLTINYQAGEWTATLSRSIGTTITVSGMTVHGYAGSTCSGGIVDDDALTLSNHLTITAGSTSDSLVTDGLTCTSKRYIISASGKINGVLRASGATFAVGGDTVHLIINHTTCSAYPC